LVGHHAQKAAHGGRLFRQTVAGHAHVAQGWASQGRQDSQQRGLAGAVRPEQRDELTRFEMQVQAAQDRFQAEGLDERPGLNHGQQPEPGGPARRAGVVRPASTLPGREPLSSEAIAYSVRSASPTA
jgi:hypothetical protein